MRERPFVVGPKVVSTPICLGCNRAVEAREFTVPAEEAGKGGRRKTRTVKSFYKCSKCKWPLCGADCEKSVAHVAECELMAERKFQCCIDYNAEEESRKESAYCVIAPLRCLLSSQSDPKK